jgi:hypothetical protein
VPSRRVQAVAVLFLAFTAVLLAIAPAPAAVWRALAGLLTAVCVWHPVRAVIFHRGRSAVRRVIWQSNGVWLITQGEGAPRAVTLHPSSASFGPWLMLAWTASPAFLARRSYALIDAASVSPVTFRALRGRLKFVRPPGRERSDRPGSSLN